MRLQIPWWLSPWREVRRIERERDVLVGQWNDQRIRIQALTGQLAEAERQNRNLMGAQTPEGAIPSSEQPDFVLVGIPRGQGKRLLAARNLAGAHFGMTDAQDPPPRWKIMATLVQPLFIDAAAYPEAMARLQEIWANWDREAQREKRAALPAEPSGRAHDSGRARELSTAPGMLPAGGDDDGKRTPGRS
jgi:hypothetical protein